MKTTYYIISRFIRLVRIVLLWPFDWLFFGGVGVLWRTREEWRAIFKDCLEKGKPLPKLPFVIQGANSTDDSYSLKQGTGFFEYGAWDGNVDDDGIRFFPEP